MRAAEEYLRDILEAVQAIGRYAALGWEAFERDELIRVWIIHHLEVIGEAAARLGGLFMRRIPWACATSWSTSTSAWTWTRCGGRWSGTCRTWRPE